MKNKRPLGEGAEEAVDMVQWSGKLEKSRGVGKEEKTDGP
jgi:hypothetical protein